MAGAAGEAALSGASAASAVSASRIAYPMPMTEPAPLTEQDIVRLVDRFYDRVRVHPTLGPVFAAVVHDWDEHKTTLVAFWSSIVLKTGRYRGNPMAMHRPLPIDASHFAEWLALWQDTAHAVLAPAQAQQFVEHAQRIARSLMHGLGVQPRTRPLDLPRLR